jgi:small subunit ribosomal protein S6
METYELVVLLHPDLEIDLEKPLKKVEGLIADQKGKVVKRDDWGKRKLAYQIQNQDYAIYVYFEVELPKTNISKLDGLLNITDEVVRHLLVKHVEAPIVEDDDAADIAEEDNSEEE